MNRLALTGMFAAFGIIFVACSDSENSANSISGEDNNLVEVGSSSSEIILSSSEIFLSSSSVNVPADSGIVLSSSSIGNSLDSSEEIPDTTKIIYALKPFNGPLTNPHKGFTVPTEATWTFAPEFEYGPHGTLNNGAWNLVTYGSGYQQWNKLNPAKGVYDWSELEALLEALEEHNMGYALRVFPYSPSFIKSNDTPEENYDWTPKYVYEEGAKKITATYKDNGSKAAVPVWDDSVYLHYAKEFATALAAKYDGDPRIEYIDVRTFGEIGRAHV